MIVYKIKIWDGYIAGWYLVSAENFTVRYYGTIHPVFEDKLLPWYWVKVYK